MQRKNNTLNKAQVKELTTSKLGNKTIRNLVQFQPWWLFKLTHHRKNPAFSVTLRARWCSLPCMNLIIEHYEDLVDYASRLIAKKSHSVLYEGLDVVHDLIINGKTYSDKTEIKREIWNHIKAGSISSANYYIPGGGILDEKICRKCKKSKLVQYEFQLIRENRRNRQFEYYSSQCKACLDEYNKVQKKTPKAVKRINAHLRVWNKKQSDELTDYYIVKIIKRAYKDLGFKKMTEDISEAEISLQRIIIANKRLNRPNRYSIWKN